MDGHSTCIQQLENGEIERVLACIFEDLEGTSADSCPILCKIEKN